MTSSQAQSDMDVEESASTNKSVMASSGTVGSVSMSLHPLVIMNISEHWTRIRAQEGAAHQGINIIIVFFFLIESVVSQKNI